MAKPKNRYVDKQLRQAFALLADAIEQRDEVIGSVDPQVRAGLIQLALGSASQACAILAAELGPEMRAAERAARRNNSQ